jgi:hypothetical protein
MRGENPEAGVVIGEVGSGWWKCRSGAGAESFGPDAIVGVLVTRCCDGKIPIQNVSGLTCAGQGGR